MRKFLLALMLMLALLAILAGCAKPNQTGTTASSMPALSGHSLANTSWVLVSYGDPNNPTAVIPGTQVTLQFNADTTRATGSGGVNGYGADCARFDNQITFSNILHTELASTNPLINAQENAYFQLLLNSQSVYFGTDTITITCTGYQVLNFTFSYSSYIQTS
jgi:heat shock protein HslJ